MHHLIKEQMNDEISEAQINETMRIIYGSMHVCACVCYVGWYVCTICLLYSCLHSMVGDFVKRKTQSSVEFTSFMCALFILVFMRETNNISKLGAKYSKIMRLKSQGLNVNKTTVMINSQCKEIKFQLSIL